MPRLHHRRNLMILIALAQAATGPTTQQAVEQAVQAKADQWYTPIIAAIALGGVAIVGVVVTFVVTLIKSKAAVVEANSKADIAAAEARAAAAEAKGKADAAAARAEAAE